MRILFFGTYFQFRGRETYVSDEIDSMVEQFPNLEYLIYTVGPFNEKNCLVRYSENIIWVQRKNLKNLNVLLLFFKDMIKIFTKFKPDVIHSIYVIESLIMGLLGKLFRIPSIFHSRGMDFNYDPFISIKSNILARIACKLNKKVITVSKAMKLDGLKLNIPQKKVITLYDGIDIKSFTPSNKKDNIENKKIEILNVGRFYPVKCQELLIEVCKKLKEDRFDFHLTITGYGPLENKLINLIKKNNLEDWIYMAGYTDHDKIPELMNKSDLYVQPS
ncbi:MAG: glycosyltransferase family 4 protein, partial [Promethearchaeota archaeon]